jgi:hypothetical protein
MSEEQGTKETKPAEAGAAVSLDELVRTIRTAAYGSIALGAVLLGLSIDAVVRDLHAVAISPLASGVYSLLVAILLLRVASAIEVSGKSEHREQALTAALASFFSDKVRYLTLTLVLSAIGFLAVHV